MHSIVASSEVFAGGSGVVVSLHVDPEHVVSPSAP